MGITFLYPSTQISDRKAIAIAEEDDSQRMFLRAPKSRHCEQPTPTGPGSTARVKIISGSLVIIENLFPQNYRYRYRLEIWTNSFNYHYRYRLGVRSHPFISIDSQLPSKVVWINFAGLPLPLRSWNVFELEGNNFECDGISAKGRRPNSAIGISSVMWCFLLVKKTWLTQQKNYRNCHVHNFAIPIAHFHHQPNIAAISDALLLI